MQMMMPADIGAAAAYEAWRNWSAYQGTYMQPLSADRGRQREAFLGLAIGEGEPFYRIRFGFGRLSFQCSFKGRDALLHPMLARSLCSLRKKLMYLYSAARLWNYTANPMDTQSRLVAVEGAAATASKIFVQSAAGLGAGGGMGMGGMGGSPLMGGGGGLGVGGLGMSPGIGGGAMGGGQLSRRAPAAIHAQTIDERSRNVRRRWIWWRDGRRDGSWSWNGWRVGRNGRGGRRNGQSNGRNGRRVG